MCLFKWSDKNFCRAAPHMFRLGKKKKNMRFKEDGRKNGRWRWVSVKVFRPSASKEHFNNYWHFPNGSGATTMLITRRQQQSTFFYYFGSIWSLFMRPNGLCCASFLQLFILYKCIHVLLTSHDETSAEMFVFQGSFSFLSLCKKTKFIKDWI